MRVLLTGANGYIGLRLLPSLLELGHQVVVMVRDLERFPCEDFVRWEEQVEYLTGDMLCPESLPELGQIEAAYYFLHSMGAGTGFEEREAACARNFVSWVEGSGCQQVIYLGGLSGLSGEGDEPLSKHMSSRQYVAEVLQGGSYNLTVLRASIIVGSGSASFEIIRDLVEKLPVMVTPRWTATRCQPIAIRNVIGYLTGVLGHTDCFGRSFDIGGPEVLTYRDMLIQYAKVRGLTRMAWPVPLLTPRLSSYWLYFMTATTYSLAKSLVESLHIESVAGESRIREIVTQELLGYEEAIDKALARIAQNRVASVWYDALSSGQFNDKNLGAVRVPEHGVYIDSQEVQITGEREDVINEVWSIGGDRGWPTMNWAWRCRGGIDKLIGGIGMRRGRRHPTELRVGDALDFWRVILADRDGGRLILYAEMKLPGEAWLEFDLSEERMTQKASFRPKGLLGRMYWWAVYPIHLVLFPRMARRLVTSHSTK